ncbi:MAG TPA: helix-turn-helix domain-containing protein [Streptosporangiaceae bacterium]|nr:helix-turn-helix domain-containing protein [Streptosporangiaceae bacterium]
MQTTTVEAADVQPELDLDDPRPLRELRLHLVDRGSVVEVHVGGYVLTAYPKNDPGLRNLAIIALTESSVRGYRVAELFGLSPVQISRIRADYRQHGSAGLAKKRGRPALLDDEQIRQARRWAGEKVSRAEIARRLNVSRPTIVELLKQHGPLDADPTLDTDHPWDGDQPVDQPVDVAADQPVDQPVDQAVDQATDEATEAANRAVGGQADEQIVGGGDGRGVGGGPGPLPLPCGTVRSRYAGAMLTHAFTARIGAEQILARAVSRPGTGLDTVDLMVLNATRMGFTLGALTLEQTKHLLPDQAGPLTGWSTLPSLRTWRTRLGRIGDRVDPLRLHRDLVTAMLDYTPPARGVVFADDHVVEYTGGQPVGWARNPRRGKATKAHDDTYVCDLAGRALVYATGEPSGLSVTLPGVLTQLSATWPATTDDAGADPDAGTDARADADAAARLRGRRPIVVFDRGAAYPATFTTVYAAGYDFICFRRAPLAAPAHLPVLATLRRAGHDIEIAYTDERVETWSVPAFLDTGLGCQLRDFPKA